MEDAEEIRIGFDLDGVIADIASQLLKFIRRSLGITLCVEEFTSEDIENCTPVSREHLVCVLSVRLRRNLVTLFLAEIGRSRVRRTVGHFSLRPG